MDFEEEDLMRISLLLEEKIKERVGISASSNNISDPMSLPGLPQSTLKAGKRFFHFVFSQSIVDKTLEKYQRFNIKLDFKVAAVKYGSRYLV